MKYLKDPWLQVFGFLALASGVMAAQRLGPGAFNPGAAIKISSPPPVVEQKAQQPEPARTLKSKAPGKWVVDAALAMDADTNKLGEALANAAAGDTIYIRVGNYKESVTVKRDAVLVGLGAQRDIVVDGDLPGPTLAVDGAKVSMKNLTISHSGTRPGKAIESRRATLEMATVAIKAGFQDDGIDAIGGSVTASYGTIEGGHRGLDAHDEAKISLDHMSVTRAETGVYLQGATAHITESFLSDDKKGLTVAEQGQAAVINGEFARDGVAVWANRGGQATISSSRFPGHNAGILADERGRVETKDCAFTDGAGLALAADSAGQVIDRGSTILRDRSSAAQAKGQGTLALIDTQIEDCKGDAIAVTEASAALSGVKIVRGARAGLLIAGATAVRLEKTAISGNAGPGIQVDGAEIDLKGSTLTRNAVAVSFTGEGKTTINADNTDFSGNAGGPFHYDSDRKDKIAVRGKNNNPRDLPSLIQ